MNGSPRVTVRPLGALALLAATALLAQPALAQAPIRINVNGPAHVGTDYPGNWAADAGAGGVCGPSAFVSGAAINGTVDDPLFQGEVYGNPGVCAVGGGSLPAGDYVVNLYFAEIYFGPGCAGGGAGTGARVFDIVLEGATVETSFDIFSEGGCAASTTDSGTSPVVKSYLVTINDGTLDISLPATANNGKISAIEILAACTGDPDCDDGNVCTDDSCVGSVCQNVANSGPCSDGVNCTTGDSCSGGACVGVPDDLLCDDSNVCTDNTCDPVLDCQTVPNTGGCDDGIACTDSDTCMAGSCAGMDDCPVGQFCDLVPPGACLALEAEALFSMSLNAGLDASTFTAGSFALTNSSPGGQQIVRLEVDFSTALLPDLVFDPVGAAGDVAGKCLTADSGAVDTGFVAPTDPCVDPFSSPHDGGYDVIEVLFGDFDPGESFTFSTDVDPTSIQGGSTSGFAGAVSGLELSGATVTVEFSDASTLTGQVFHQPGSDGGSLVVVKEGAPPAPGISVLGIPSPPASTTEENQTIQISGPAGATVRLLQVEGELELVAAPGFDLDPFEANTAVLVNELSATIGPGGTVDIPVTLTSVGPDGLNYFQAVIEATGGETGATSAVVVLELIVLQPCTIDEDCDDGNDCTVDTCNVDVCEFTNEPATTACDLDANACTTDECDGAGACANVGSVSCPPGEFCNTGTGVCAPPPNDMDNDGIEDGSDPCPADPRNLCFGPVATDGTTGSAIRINAIVGTQECAGPKVDCNGDAWEADFGFNLPDEDSVCNLGGGGEGCAIAGIAALFGCEDPEELPDPTAGDGDTEDIFQCEHWDAVALPELSYDFDLPDGNYVVNLYFANAFTGTSTAGSRVFDILIEGALVYDDFDQVVAAGGSGIAVVRSAVVAVAGGGGLQIELVHGVENPAIKGIEVLAEGVDGDGDGFTIFDGDCDDNDINSFPGNPELCDGNDNDCDAAIPVDETDDDGDGYVECTGWDDTQADNPAVLGGDDCDDADDAAFPGNPEVCDGVDNDCNTTIDDGFGVGTSCGTGQCGGGLLECTLDGTSTQCSTQPGGSNDQSSAEVCDGVDNDCDTTIDEEPEASASCDPGDICISGACQPEPQATVILPTGLQVPPGGDVVVPITVDPADGVVSMDLFFQYDPAVLLPTAVFTTAFTDGWTLTENLGISGEVLISLFDADPLAGTGEVAWVVFQAVGPAGSGSDLVWTNVNLNENGIPATSQDGRVDITNAQTVLSVPDCVAVDEGGTVLVPIVADPADGFFAVDLEVHYNPLVVTAVSVTTTTPPANNCSVIPNVGTPGVVTAALFCTTVLSGTGPIVQIEFQAVGLLGSSTPIDLRTGTVNEFPGPQGIESTLDDGLLAVSTDDDGDGLAEGCGDCDDTNPDVFPGAPEICDGVDNQCDGDPGFGQIDEGFDLGTACGVGECAGGVTECTTDGQGTQCSTESGGTDNQSSTEQCDGLDNDCNGIDDDGFNVGQSCTVGVGECEASGLIVCTTDGTASECDAVAGDPEPEICDGLDNDCDDDVDNGADAGCDNGLFCDGVETCGGVAGCQDGLAVDCSDGSACTLDVCVEGVGEATCENPPSSDCDISGSVLYYRDLAGGGSEPSTKGVPAIDIDLSPGLTSDGSGDATTDGLGNYSLSAVSGTVNVTTLAEMDDPDTIAVTSFDAALVSQDVVGLLSLSSNQQIAGDVTGNGALSSFDAAKISQYWVLLIDDFEVALATGSDWAFLRCDNYVDEDDQDCVAPVHVHDPLTEPVVDDFYAILYGDVSGNWQPTAPGAAAAVEETDGRLMGLSPGSTRGVMLRPAAETPTGPSMTAATRPEGLPAASIVQSVRAGSRAGTREIVIEIKNADGIIGLDLELGYDPTAVSVVGVRALDAAAGHSLASNDEAGRLRLALFGPASLPGSGAILAIEVEIDESLDGASPFEVQGQANEGRIPLSVDPVAGAKRLVRAPEGRRQLGRAGSR